MVMKGNLHKKMTFDDGDGKRHIKSCFNGWRAWKKRRCRTARRKMNRQIWLIGRED